MPFFKRRRFSRRGYGTRFKRAFPKRKSRVYKTATRAAKRVVARNVETKYTEAASELAFGSAAMTVIPVAYPSQNVADIDRIGDRIKVVRLNINFYHRYSSAGGLPYAVRILVIQWKPQAAQTPSPFTTSTLFSNISPGTPIVISPYAWDTIHSKTWRPVYDRTFNMTSTSGGSANASDVLNTRVRLSGMKKFEHTVQFLGGLADNLSNSFYIVIVTNIPLSDSPNIAIHQRLTFKDA